MLWTGGCGMNNDWRMYIGDEDYLMHHGIRGQKWGIRRFQNTDGTLTTAGQKRYGEKVTMHKGGKENWLLGKRTYNTHKEYVTANKFAKATYEKNKANIKDQYRKEREEGKSGALRRSIAKRMDNAQQYNYELDRNRWNAGVNEFKRETAIKATKRAAAATAVVGAGVLAGMLHANYMNNKMKRESLGALPAAGMEQYYEYKVGKAQVAKYISKAVVIGALSGAYSAGVKNLNANDRVYNQNKRDRKYNVQNSRAKRAAADEARWRKGEV